MTFNEELNIALHGESTITDLVGQNIFLHHVPDNYSNKIDAIIFESNISEAQHTISIDNYGDYYTLAIKIVSSSDTTIYSIAAVVKAFLITLASSKIRQVMFLRDVQIYNHEDDVWVLNLDYQIDYCNE